METAAEAVLFVSVQRKMGKQKPEEATETHVRCGGGGSRDPGSAPRTEISGKDLELHSCASLEILEAILKITTQ